jgi:hypothetical protein
MANPERRVGAGLKREGAQESLGRRRGLLAGNLHRSPRRSLALTLERMVHLPRPAQRHLESTNVGIMEEELTMFRRRKAALEHRRQQLMRA